MLREKAFCLLGEYTKLLQAPKHQMDRPSAPSSEPFMGSYISVSRSKMAVFGQILNLL